MEKMEIEKRIKELREEVLKHDGLYAKNQPIITDSEYDSLYAELERLEDENPEFYDENSPTQRITDADGETELFTKVAHEQPVLSQQKTKSCDGILDWYNSSIEEVDVEDKSFYIQKKLDGLTLCVTYKDGKLTQAVTRGNGKVGESLYSNALFINNLPKTIQFKGEVNIRGEVIISIEDFEKANVDGMYSNPRNLASGTIRNLDGSKVSERNLQFIAFTIQKSDGIRFNDEGEALDFLDEQGFTVVDGYPLNLVGLSDEQQYVAIENAINMEKDNRSSLPYQIDGLVIKFNNYEIQEELGSTRKHPKWAIAYKFESQDEVTTLREIIWQTGKTGKITPVAVFDPVEIDGARITKASLHNLNIIKSKDIKLGDKILVKRANDVIPQIEKSFSELRDGSELEIVFPDKCPGCGSTNVSVEEESCMNPNCSEKKLHRLIHLVDRDAMNIAGIGPASIEILVEGGILNEPKDLFELDKDELLDAIGGFDGITEATIDTMLATIEEAKKRETPLSTILYSMSINLCGKTVSEAIANEFLYSDILSAFDDTYASTKTYDVDSFYNQMISLDGIGGLIATAFKDYMADENFFHEFKGLAGSVNMVNNKRGAFVGSGNLAGRSFCITGTLPYVRSDVEALISEHGGINHKSIKSGTDYLIVANPNLNTTKIQNARKKGVKIIDYNDLIDMIS